MAKITSLVNVLNLNKNSISSLYKKGLFLIIWILINLVHSSIIALIGSQIYKYPFIRILPVAYIAGIFISFFSASFGYITGRILFFYLSEKAYLKSIKTTLHYMAVIIVSILGALTGLILNAFLLKWSASISFWNQMYLMKTFWIFATIISAAIISIIAISIEILLIHNKQYMNQIELLSRSSEDFLTFREAGTIRRVRFNDILYVSSSGKKCILYTETENFDISLSLKKIIVCLPENIFLRVHRQYIINIKKAKSLKHYPGGLYFVILKDEDESPIPVGRRFMTSVRSHMKTPQNLSKNSH